MLRIVVKNNCQFGGYRGYLANENNTPLNIPFPFNVSANQYCHRGKDAKECIIKLCKRDGEVIFNELEFNIIDLTT